MRDYWYKLVTDNGELIIDADTVSLPENSQVVKFRDEIKKKNSNLLKGIDPGQLRVYLSTDNFELATADLLGARRVIHNNEELLIVVPRMQYSIPIVQSGTRIIPFPPNSGAIHEGLPDAGKPVIQRETLVGKIADTLSKNMSLLITSPSFTGKTSLANLMYNHWKGQKELVRYISFADLKPGQDLDDFFVIATGLTSQEIMRNKGYLIMDETQNIYNHSTFWGGLKSGAQICRLLAFGVFGLSNVGNDRSPSQFQLKWYYDNVKFSDEECDELVGSFCRVNESFRQILVPEVLGNLFQFLNNHPGLVYLALHTLCYEFTRTPYNAKEMKDIRPLIAKGILLQELFKKARCFALTYDKIKRMLGSKTDEIILS
jgi:hypothetical protein